MVSNIAGVVLAGGKSSRMGKNKALLDYNGKKLIDHMIALLKQSGIKDIFISGNIKGYDNSIPDTSPFEGPAYAIYEVLEKLSNYERVLFLPVDMPLLSPDMLHLLIEHEKGGYFCNYPLPAILRTKPPKARVRSVKELLSIMDIMAIDLPAIYKDSMKNTNTPEQWQEVISS